jgi:hypothetical protein
MSLSPLDQAKQTLSIRDVILRGTKVEIGKGIITEELEPSESNHLESYRGVQNFEVGEVVLNDDDMWLYRFNYSIGIRLIDGPEDEVTEVDSNVLVTILAEFDVCYYANKEMSDEECSAFSENNVGYHAWPYWREYVQSTCQRIGMVPSFPVPVYILE